MAKSMAQMMDELQDPVKQELMSKYQNARDAVSWAYKMAQEYMDCRADAISMDTYVKGISAVARELIPMIEADLNRTLEVLNESKS